MIHYHTYKPDDYVDAGIAQESRLKIVALINDRDAETMPSCAILYATLKFDDGQILEITKQVQGVFEDHVVEDFLKRRREPSYDEGDEAS